MVTRAKQNTAVWLANTVNATIRAQLANSYPNEAGGFLLGEGALPASPRISAAIPVENQFAIAEQHHRYAMSPQDWLRYEDEAENRGLRLLGYYHSHPDSPAIPSEYDRAHALPNFVYLITTIQAGQAGEMRAWQLQYDRSAFAEMPLRGSEDEPNSAPCT